MNLRDCSKAFILAFVILASCKPSPEEQKAKLQQQADAYLTAYNEEFQKLYTISAEAEWTLNTKIVEGDTATQKIYEETKQKYTDYLGSQANIDSSKKYLAIKEQLTLLQVKQFEAILFAAGGSPATAAEAVKELIKVSGDRSIAYV